MPMMSEDMIAEFRGAYRRALEQAPPIPGGAHHLELEAAWRNETQPHPCLSAACKAWHSECITIEVMTINQRRTLRLIAQDDFDIIGVAQLTKTDAIAVIADLQEAVNRMT